MIEKKPDWIKAKGYLHLTPSLSTDKEWKKYYAQITNEKFIEQYAFFPLLHSNIKERKYKKFNPDKHLNTNKTGRSHRHKIGLNNTKQTVKKRPIHYASHYDALIYSYYGHLLNDRYNTILKQDSELNKCVIAYRKITDEATGKGKSTIHFAKEAFDEITRRSENETVAALTFDIESFFSGLDHKILYQKWCEVVGNNQLPKHHYKVYRACTNFSYVLRDDLRIKQTKGKRRTGFDEKKLHQIRRTKGYNCFFYDVKDFRSTIKEGNLKIYKNPFCKKLENGKSVKMGIPQGLPLSAVLANLYLLDFDRSIIKKVCKQFNGYYRRYSDDLLVVCNIGNVEEIKQYIVSEIKKYQLEISLQKTEEFTFRKLIYNKKNDERLTSIKIENGEERIAKPLIYLGFEYRGYNTSIKATNIAKYYRRLIQIVKRRAKRASSYYNNNPYGKKAIFKNQIKKLYNAPLKAIDHDGQEQKQKYRTRYNLVENSYGEYDLVLRCLPVKRQSNYITYLNRCDKIFENTKENSFKKNIRKRHNIVNHAIRKHLDRNIKE